MYPKKFRFPTRFDNGWFYKCGLHSVERISLTRPMNIPPSSLFCKGGLSGEILPFKRKSYKAILFASQPSIISLVILRMAQQ